MIDTKEATYKTKNKVGMLSIFFVLFERNYRKIFPDQLVFNTKPKIEEHILIIIHEPTREEDLSQPLQTINKQFKIAVTFLSGHIGVFNVTNKQIKFIFLPVFGRAEHNIIKIPAGAYEMESLNAANKRNFLKKVMLQKRIVHWLKIQSIGYYYGNWTS